MILPMEETVGFCSNLPKWILPMEETVGFWILPMDPSDGRNGWILPMEETVRWKKRSGGGAKWGENETVPHRSPSVEKKMFKNFGELKRSRRIHMYPSTRREELSGLYDEESAESRRPTTSTS